MRYTPQFPPDLWEELRRLERALQELTAGAILLEAPRAAPPRPVDGLLAYADGVAWNPTGAAGLHQYVGGAWARVANEPLPYAALTSVSSVLGADVSIAVANTWYTGVSVALTAGTWLLTGHITVNRTTTTAWTSSARLRDNAAAVNYASAGNYRASVANNIHTLPLTAVLTLAGAATIDLQATANQTGVIKAALVTNAAGNTATQLHAVRIA